MPFPAHKRDLWLHRTKVDMFIQDCLGLFPREYLHPFTIPIGMADDTMTMNLFENTPWRDKNAL